MGNEICDACGGQKNVAHPTTKPLHLMINLYAFFKKLPGFFTHPFD